MNPNHYETSAAFYDEGNDRPDLASDLEFYLSLIPASASVLEVGCGTGRIALPLALRGNSVTGIDLSQPMLDVFSGKLAKQPERARKVVLRRMDMKSFDLGRTFDWILFPFRVFQALGTLEERLQCLEAVRGHMSAKSRLVLTLFNPRWEALGNWGRKNLLDFERTDKKTGRTMRRYQDQLWHDPERQLIAVNLRYEVHVNGELTQTAEDSLELGYLFPEQCLGLFTSAGLGLEQAYGDYDRRPLVPEEKKEQIYVLKKAGPDPGRKT
ncbi:MAG TPA: class I SAM-dependent methyltransferase [bacterium]|jgi:SAM-dependent methyltransferase|nr:class I SAM-dependent methyltransferase [bacterium]